MATRRQSRSAFEGHQEQIRSVHVWTRDEVRGSRSCYRAAGRAVALRLVLMSWFPGLPDHALSPRTGWIVPQEA